MNNDYDAGSAVLDEVMWDLHQNTALFIHHYFLNRLFSFLMQLIIK